MKPEPIVIADSTNEGNRITTVQIKNFPKSLQAELRTHRSVSLPDLTSQSHFSSRAIPVSKFIKQVNEDPFLFTLSRNAQGMTGILNYSDQEQHEIYSEILCLRDTAVEKISALIEKYQLSKEVANRYLEPWMVGDVLITASEEAWIHFFSLRLADNVQPDMRLIAKDVYSAINDSEPKKLGLNEWHIPFGDRQVPENIKLWMKLKVSVARNARISYLNFDKNFELKKDLELYDNLYKNRHMTPFEHVALVAEPNQEYWNLKGFKSLRYLLTDTNKYSMQTSGLTIPEISYLTCV